MLAFVALASSAQTSQAAEINTTSTANTAPVQGQLFPPGGLLNNDPTQSCPAGNMLTWVGAKASGGAIQCAPIPTAANGVSQFTFPSSDGSHTYSVPAFLTCTRKNAIGPSTGKAISILFQATSTDFPGASKTSATDPDSNLNNAPGDSVIYYPATGGGWSGAVAYSVPSGAGAQMTIYKPPSPLPDSPLYGCPASIPVQVQ